MTRITLTHRFKVLVMAFTLSGLGLNLGMGLAHAQEAQPAGPPPFGMSHDPTLTAAQAAADAGDWPHAITLYEQAANQGLRGGSEQLAHLYLEGAPGLPPDYAQAMHWATKAVQAGDSRGLLYLGKIWMDGLGVQADLNKAKDLFTQADAGGDLKAPRYLGLLAARQGHDDDAARWYAKGAQRGDITSQYLLGQAYEQGKGLPQDAAAAMRWYQAAASRGDLIASDGMVGMAGLYERGEGVAPDRARALQLYRQAASLGNATALTALHRLGQ